MLNREELSNIICIVATVSNLILLIYFVVTGALNVGQAFIGCMVWFYGTVILIDHLWIEEEDDDNYAE